jgi:hypothetical protein
MFIAIVVEGVPLDALDADVGVGPAQVSLEFAGQHTPAEFAGHSLRVRLPGQVTVLLFGSWEAACAG